MTTATHRARPESQPEARPESDAGWRTHARTAERSLSLPGVLPLCLALVACLAYGNEIFNNHLTIDEEYFADINMWRAWLGDGRWGMSLLSGLLVPRAVGPVVSTSIGVFGITFALLLFVRTLTRSRSATLVAVVFGLLFPTTPFLISFATLSYGGGIGALSVTIAYLVIIGHGPRTRLLWVVGLYAFAIAIYQPFLFALPLMVLLHLAARALQEGLERRTTALRLAQVAACAVASLLVYLVVFWVARAITGIETSSYVAGQLDLAGILSDPGVRLRQSLSFVAGVLTADPVIYRGDARYVGPALIAAGLAVVVATALRRGVAQALAVVAIGAVTLAGLVLLEATTPYESALRSLVYIPFVVAGTAALGLEALLAVDRQRWSVVALAALIGAACLGLAADNNRLFLSTELLYQRDVALAIDVEQRVTQLANAAGVEPQFLSLIGARAHVEGPATPKRETIGTSFFEWDGGDPGRAAVFMRIVTGRSLASAPPDVAGRIAQQSSQRLSAWPSEGSVQILGGVAVVKLGSPTPDQRLLWCGAGVTFFCTPAP